MIITQHPSFGYWQAWIPAGNGGSVFTRYVLSDLLDTLDELAAPERGRGAADPGAAPPGLPRGRDHQGRCPVTGTTTPGRTPPVQSGGDLTARLFRALYAGFDLRTAGGVHVAVPRGVACFTGRSLGEIARQISDRGNPQEDTAPDSHQAAAPCQGPDRRGVTAALVPRRSRGAGR